MLICAALNLFWGALHRHCMRTLLCTKTLVWVGFYMQSCIRQRTRCVWFFTVSHMTWKHCYLSQHKCASKHALHNCWWCFDIHDLARATATHTLLMACLDSSRCSWCIYKAASWRLQQPFNCFRTCMLQCKYHVSYLPECRQLASWQDSNAPSSSALPQHVQEK